MERFITQEVGSMSKPEWRVKAISGAQINNHDIQDAIDWGERLGIDYTPLVDILRNSANQKPGIKMPLLERKYVRDAAALYAVRLQEDAGLDIIFDGEQDRIEMYEYAIRRSNGFEFRGRQQAFDNRYFDKAAVIARPSIDSPWHVEELKRLQGLTDHTIKVPITGAYTIAAWSFDEFYGSHKELGDGKFEKEKRREAKEEFVFDVAKNLIRPNIQALIDGGARLIQIDDPAATTSPSEVPLYVKSFNESTRGFPDDVEFTSHLCFAKDYELLLPHIEKMERCAEYSLEFANRDSRELGTRDEDRPAYQFLKKFMEYGIPGRIGLGVVDIHSDFDESEELVADRIVYASRILKDPKRLRPSQDCGARKLKLAVDYRKKSRVSKGARRAEKKL